MKNKVKLCGNCRLTYKLALLNIREKVKSFLHLIKSPYFQFISSLATFIAFFIILIFGDGLVWQTNQAELEKQKFAFEKEKEITNLRNNIDNIVNEFINLNNEIYKKEKGNGLSEEERKLLKSRYDFLNDNLNHYKDALFKLKKKSINFKIPNPLKKYFYPYDVPPAKVKGLGIKLSKRKKNFLFYTIQTNVITFIGFDLFLVVLTIFFTRMYYTNKINRFSKRSANKSLKPTVPRGA